MKGYYLPTLPIEEQSQERKGIPVAAPILSASRLVEISNRLIESQKKLAAESIFKIVDWIDAAARCWADPNDSIRQEAESLLPQITGDSPEMVHFTLDDFHKHLTRPVLLQFLEPGQGQPGGISPPRSLRPVIGEDPPRFGGESRGIDLGKQRA